MTLKRQLILLRLWTTFALLGESAMLSVLLAYATSGVALLFLSPLFLLFILMVLLLVLLSFGVWFSRHSAYLISMAILHIGLLGCLGYPFLPFLYSVCRDDYGHCRHWQWFF